MDVACGCAPGIHVDIVAQLLSTETMTKNNYVTLSIHGEIPFHTYEGSTIEGQLYEGSTPAVWPPVDVPSAVIAH